MLNLFRDFSAVLQGLFWLIELTQNDLQKCAWVAVNFFLAKNGQLTFESLGQSNPFEFSVRLLTNCNLDSLRLILFVTQDEVTFVLNNDLKVFELRNIAIDTIK